MTYSNKFLNPIRDGAVRIGEPHLLRVAIPLPEEFDPLPVDGHSLLQHRFDVLELR